MLKETRRRPVPKDLVILHNYKVLLPGHHWSLHSGTSFLDEKWSFLRCNDSVFDAVFVHWIWGLAVFFSQFVAIFAFFLIHSSKELFLFFRCMPIQIVRYLILIFRRHAKTWKHFRIYWFCQHFLVWRDHGFCKEKWSNLCTDQSVRDRYLTGVIKLQSFLGIKPDAKIYGHFEGFPLW